MDNTTDEPFVKISLLMGFSTAALFVLARLILQFLSPVFSTRSMRLQFQYCVALFGHYVMFIAGLITPKNTEICKAIAILEYYTLLTTFVWMAVLSLDMYRTLRTMTISSAATVTNKKMTSEQFREIAIESVIGWGAMLPSSALAVGLDHVDSIDSVFKMKFGHTLCLSLAINIEQSPYFATAFVTFLFNALMFVLTALHLRKAFNTRRRLTLTKRCYYVTYVRLFIIMGVHYVLALFLPFFDSTILTLLTGAAHTFQGVYIAVAFVFTRKVWDSLKSTRICSKIVEAATARRESSHRPDTAEIPESN